MVPLHHSYIICSNYRMQWYQPFENRTKMSGFQMVRPFEFRTLKSPVFRWIRYSDYFGIQVSGIQMVTVSNVMQYPYYCMHALRAHVSAFLFLRSFLNFQIRKTLMFFDLRNLGLVEGEKMNCGVILLWNEIGVKFQNANFTKLCL